MVVVASAMSVLAALGLLVSGVVAPTIGNDSLWCLKRQIVAFGVGLVAAVFVARLPWSLWLRAAPCLRMNLTLGWRGLFAVLVVGGGLLLACQIMTNENRLIRVKSFFGLAEPAAAAALPVDEHAAEQKVLYEAYRTSKWIGQIETRAGKHVPNGHTAGVSSGMAVAFGKVVPWGVLTLFGIVLTALTIVRHYLTDAVGRMILLVYGLWLCVPAAYNIAECANLVPYLGIGIPLVSYGLTATLVACIGYGVVWSMVATSSVPESKPHRGRF